MTPTSYTTVVAKTKEIARDNLRMELISARQTNIAELTKAVTSAQKELESAQKAIAQSNYNISKVDDANPSADDVKKFEATRIEDVTACIADINKEIETLNKTIASENEGIANIENGTTKICLDSLNDLTDDLLASITENSAIVATATDMNVAA